MVVMLLASLLYSSTSTLVSPTTNLTYYAMLTSYFCAHTHTLSRLQLMRRKSPSPELPTSQNERTSPSMLSIPEGGEPVTTIEREPATKTREEGKSISVNGEVSNNNQGKGLKRHISK